MKTLKDVVSNQYFGAYFAAAKRVVSNQYFPAGAVLSGVVLFWTFGLLGGLSLLSTAQTLLTTVAWLFFVYAATVLSPIAGLLAAADLIRRWLRHRTPDEVRA